MCETLRSIPTVIKEVGGARRGTGEWKGQLIYFRELEKRHSSNMSKALPFLFIVSFYSSTAGHLLKQYKM